MQISVCCSKAGCESREGVCLVLSPAVAHEAAVKPTPTELEITHVDTQLPNLTFSRLTAMSSDLAPCLSVRLYIYLAV